MLASAFGLDFLLSKRPESSPQAPQAQAGFSYQVTDSGQFFSKRIQVPGQPVITDEDAANEHQRDDFTLLDIFRFWNEEKWTEIEKKYSIGIRLYFSFVKFLIMINGGFAVLALASFLPHIAKINSKFQDAEDAGLIESQDMQKLEYMWPTFSDLV